jgi:hypothetical protein
VSGGVARPRRRLPCGAEWSARWRFRRLPTTFATSSTHSTACCPPSSRFPARSTSTCRVPGCHHRVVQRPLTCHGGVPSCVRRYDKKKDPIMNRVLRLLGEAD